jgi:hypothetical protein
MTYLLLPNVLEKAAYLGYGCAIVFVGAIVDEANDAVLINDHRAIRYSVLIGREFVVFDHALDRGCNSWIRQLQLIVGSLNIVSVPTTAQRDDLGPQGPDLNQLGLQLTELPHARRSGTRVIEDEHDTPLPLIVAQLDQLVILIPQPEVGSRLSDQGRLPGQNRGTAGSQEQAHE